MTKHSKEKKSFSQLNFDIRMTIQACLSKKMSLSTIARMINKSVSTVSREIRRNSKYDSTNRSNLPCDYRDKYFTCNSCSRKAYCNKRLIIYNCNYAETNAEIISSSSRSIPKLPKESIELIDEIVTFGIRNHQSLHHIYVANKELHKICCEQTIRRLLYNRHLTVGPSELPRFVRYKRSYKKPKTVPELKDFSKIIGRTYTDYIKYKDKHRKAVTVQFDSVIGKKTDKKAILTIHWKEYNFQIGLLIQKGSSSSVNKAMNKLFSNFTLEETRKLFPICLSDNGSEFQNFYEIEETKEGLRRTRVFYTRPYRSTDKSECERNHELFRYILPKGNSFDEVTQEELNTYFSNINSYVRKSKSNQAPFDLMCRRFGKDLVMKLGITRVDKRLVCLKKNH